LPKPRSDARNVEVGRGAAPPGSVAETDMRDEEVGAVLRAVRHRRGLRQSDVGRRARMARSRLTGIERGDLSDVPLGVLRAYASVLGVRIDLLACWHGADLARLLDADHARLQEAWKRRLQRQGWQTRAEVTFSHFGERGSYDLLAFEPASRTLLVVEVKTVVADLGGLLRQVDVKERLAVNLAARPIGWQPRCVVPCLIVADTRTNRRRLAEHEALLDRYAVRGHAAIAWLRQPGAEAGSGLLVVSKAAQVTTGDLRQAGRRRIRSSADRSSVESSRHPGPNQSGGG
jgi:transcriptional regulator with XRE-family HTH domain